MFHAGWVLINIYQWKTNFTVNNNNEATDKSFRRMSICTSWMRSNLKIKVVGVNFSGSSGRALVFEIDGVEFKPGFHLLLLLF